MSTNDSYTDTESAFARAFSTSGTLCSTECDCGRIHFVSCSGHGDYEDGELEELQAKSAADPDKYVECYHYDTIDITHVDGRQLVVQCKCKKAHKYIGWLEDHFDQLADYLRVRCEQEIGLAEQRLTDLRHKKSVADELYRLRYLSGFMGDGI